MKVSDLCGLGKTLEGVTDNADKVDDEKLDREISALFADLREALDGPVGCSMPGVMYGPDDVDAAWGYGSRG